VAGVEFERGCVVGFKALDQILIRITIPTSRSSLFRTGISAVGVSTDMPALCPGTTSETAPWTILLDARATS